MKNDYRTRPKPIEVYTKLIQKLGREPSLAEWLADGTFKRTTWYEARKIYRAITEIDQ